MALQSTILWEGPDSQSRMDERSLDEARMAAAHANGAGARTGHQQANLP